MREFTLVGGEVVTDRDVVRTNVVVQDGRIAALSEDRPTGDRVDVSGLLVFPGMVDTHVHLMDPGPTDREDFPTGTRAAAARGVTTIVEHTHAEPIRSVSDLDLKRSHLRGRSNVDFGLAAHVWPDRFGHIAELWDAGVTFFKIFTCTTHGVPGLDAAELWQSLEAIGASDARTLIHCEDESITALAERMLKEAGRTDNGLLTEWRNREAELVAVAAAATLAGLTGAKATLAHVSNQQVIEVIESARIWGADIAAEACPQYFALDESEVLREGPLRKFTPPARISSNDDRAAMWDAVRTGAYSHFSTDHAPSTLEQKSAGGIWDAPFGLPGLDTTFPFLLDAALTGRIGISDVARLYASAPAERYGLAPRKGVVRPGADADLVLVDPEGSWKVSDDDIVSKAGWSPYSGTTFRGRVVATWLRGQEVARDGVAHDQRGGEFLPGMGTRR